MLRIPSRAVPGFCTLGPDGPTSGTTVAWRSMSCMEAEHTGGTGKPTTFCDRESVLEVNEIFVAVAIRAGFCGRPFHQAPVLVSMLNVNVAVAVADRQDARPPSPSALSYCPQYGVLQARTICKLLANDNRSKPPYSILPALSSSATASLVTCIMAIQSPHVLLLLRVINPAGAQSPTCFEHHSRVVRLVASLSIPIAGVICHSRLRSRQ
ncbi:hypothetical protein F4777DRAFT_289528 [Nemania sp. FL0916]|nr:hypothetical protein F4777DRAFT_289528 [Nemania sp. FL0916]